MLFVYNIVPIYFFLILDSFNILQLATIETCGGDGNY